MLVIQPQSCSCKVLQLDMPALLGVLGAILGRVVTSCDNNTKHDPHRLYRVLPNSTLTSVRGDQLFIKGGRPDSACATWCPVTLCLSSDVGARVKHALARSLTTHTITHISP